MGCCRAFRVTGGLGELDTLAASLRRVGALIRKSLVYLQKDYQRTLRLVLITGTSIVGPGSKVACMIPKALE